MTMAGARRWCGSNRGDAQGREAAVRATLEAEGAGAGGDGAGGAGVPMGFALAGKRLNDPLQLRLDALLEEEADVCCPVTLVLLADPVRARDGFAYERSAAQALCTGAGGAFVSPMTREELPAELAADPPLGKRPLAFRREAPPRCSPLRRRRRPSSPTWVWASSTHSGT